MSIASHRDPEEFAAGDDASGENAFSGLRRRTRNLRGGRARGAIAHMLGPAAHNCSLLRRETGRPLRLQGGERHLNANRAVQY